MRKLGLCLCLLLLTGCAAKSVDTNGLKVKTTREKPTGNCAQLGEVTGAQGNWFTGPYTSNKNLHDGAVNDLRNQAGKMGGNLVWIHEDKMLTGHQAETVNALIIGTVYRCE